MYTVLKENDEARREVNLDIWHKAGYTGKGVNILVCDFHHKIFDWMKSYAIETDPEGIMTIGKNIKNHNVYVTQVNHEASPEATIYVAPWTHSSDEIIEWLRANPNLIDIAGASLTSPVSDAYDIFEELGIVFTASSGNDYDRSRQGVNYPADMDYSIAVGAFNWKDKGIDSNDVIGYSNGGEDLFCLGLSNIYVQNEDKNYIFPYTGTSTSRPFLTGMLACYIQWRKENGLPKLTQKEAKEYIKNNCLDLRAENFDWDSGFGLFKLPSSIPIIEKPIIPEPEIIIIEPTPIPIQEPISGGDTNMSYSITQKLISMNRPKEAFQNLKGIVIHSTANIGATSLNHYNYWNNADRQSSVHFIADWNGEDILQLIPENEIAWHTGSYQGNREWLGIEMCETSSIAQFNIVWNKTIWFVADLCIRHNWNVDDNVWSHNGLRSLYSGVDHTDPYGYLTRMGKTWQQLCDAIDAEIKRRKSIPISPTPTPSNVMYRVIMDNKQISALSSKDLAILTVKELVDSGRYSKGVVQRNIDSVNIFEYTKPTKIKSGNVIFSLYKADLRAAEYLADYTGDINAVDISAMTQDIFENYETIIQVGGQKYNSNVTLHLTGNDMFDTLISVLKYIGKL